MNDIFIELSSIGAETDSAIERFMGDEGKYLKHIKNFPDEGSMPALEAAVAAKDYESAKAAVHALKGIVSNLGFTPLTDAAVDMYAELLDGNTAEALDEFKNVQKQYRRFCDIILNWRAK